MQTTRIALAALPAFALGLGILSAQQTKQSAAPQPATVAGNEVEPMRPETFTVDQSIAAAVEILRRRGIEFGEGFGDVIVYNDDLSCLNFRLDADHTYVELCYSKSRRTVTGLTMTFYPSRLNGAKSTQSHLSAQSLFLYPDTSYAVHFSKPQSLEELDRRDAEIQQRKSVYPTPNFGSGS